MKVVVKAPGWSEVSIFLISHMSAKWWAESLCLGNGVKNVLSLCFHLKLQLILLGHQFLTLQNWGRWAQPSRNSARWLYAHRSGRYLDLLRLLGGQFCGFLRSLQSWPLKYRSLSGIYSSGSNELPLESLCWHLSTPPWRALRQGPRSPHQDSLIQPLGNAHPYQKY